MQHRIFSLSVVESMKFYQNLMNLSGQWTPDLAPPPSLSIHARRVGDLSFCTPFTLSATLVRRSVPAHTIFWPLPSNFSLRSHTLITLDGPDAEENMVLSVIVIVAIRPGFPETVPIFEYPSRENYDVAPLAREAHLSRFCAVFRFCTEFHCPLSDLRN